jgi:hypothetical protein
MREDETRAAVCVLGSGVGVLEACEVLAARSILLGAIGKVVIGSKLFGSGRRVS